VAKADYGKVVDPVLPVRHVLHDQVSVRAAASLERRFPHLMLRAKRSSSAPARQSCATGC